jgi:hypothetical protein
MAVAALVGHNLEKHNLLQEYLRKLLTYLKSTRMISLSRNTFNTESMGEVLRSV